jgi:hypothetical protein
VIGNGNSRHVQPLDLLYKVFEPYRTVEKRILGVEVKMDERHKVKAAPTGKYMAWWSSVEEVFYSG